MKDNCIYECRYEDNEGLILNGKMVNKIMFGVGSYRLSNGKLFKGEILENMTACGEMLDGNIKIEGAWNIVCKENMYSFIISGKFKQFTDNRLEREGITEGERFTGTIYEADKTILTGSWVNCEFENIKISKDNRLTELKRLSNISYSETTYENSVLISKFTLTNKQKEGDAYFKTAEGERTVKFENGAIVWIRIKEKSQTYEGFMKDDQYHGKGKLETDQLNYSGNFEKGKFHGQGTLDRKKEKRTECGSFNNGNMVKGVVNTSNRKYDGSLNLLGKAEGKGMLTTPELKYDGIWKNDKYHGEGILEHIKTGRKLRGRFEDGRFISGDITMGNESWRGSFNHAEMLDGEGKYDSPEISYEGFWKDAKFHGQGTLLKKIKRIRMSGRFENNRFANGELVDGAVTFSGAFNSDEKVHGTGTEKTPEYTYTGEFSNGKRQGKGKQTMTNGNIKNGDFINGMLSNGEFTCEEYKYHGIFLNDSFHGQGTLILKNGTIKRGNFQGGSLVSGTLECPEYTYNGAFVNDRFHGNGKLTMKDRSIKEGTFQNGELVNGKFEHADFTYVGVFANGQFNGNGTKTMKDGTVQQGTFQHGNIVSGTFQCGSHTYVGSFANNVAHGYGKVTQSDGRTLEGTFQNGVFVNGTEIVPPSFRGGYKYTGAFSNDHYHGYGVLVMPDYTVSGTFANSYPTRDCKISFHNPNPFVHFNLNLGS